MDQGQPESFYDESKDPPRDELLCRSSIPHRVKSGSVNESGLILDTLMESRLFDWSEVIFLSLGIIKYQKDTGKVPHSRIRKTIRQNLFGEDKEDPKPEYTENNLLDIYMRDIPAPYRIDSGIINYRGFLKSPGYVSAINFRRLVKLIAYHASSSNLDPNLTAYLQKRKDYITTYASIYDFQDACSKMLKSGKKLVPRGSVIVELED